jgi:hypothetical protein
LTVELKAPFVNMVGFLSLGPRFVLVRIQCTAGEIRCGRAGRWRLSLAGLSLARRLYPNIKRPTKRQLATDIALVQAMERRTLALL